MIRYFYKEPKLNGYYFEPKNNFEYGVEIHMIVEDPNDSDNYLEIGDVQEEYFKYISWCVENLGYDPKRYEPLIDLEFEMIRIYFRDECDQAAFKLIWGGENDE